MRRVLAATCALVLLLLAPGGFPAAGAVVSTSIVPGKSLGPVQLGMSEDDITQLLGAPAPAQGGWVAFLRWDVTVTFKNGLAAWLGTTNPQFRTRTGAGVGILIDDATRLVGDRTLDLTTTDGDVDVLYPARGIGFVFRHGVAVEVFVVAPGSVTLSNLSLAVPPAGSVPPGPVTLFLRPSPPPPPAPPVQKPRGVPTGARPEVALENITSMADPAKGVFRISGEIANVGSTTLDGVTFAATFVKSSGDETRRQAGVPLRIAAGSTAPFTLETPLLQTVIGADLVLRYTVEVVAGGDRLQLALQSYTVPVETYADLARGQVKVDVQFGPPSNTARTPLVQVLVSISGTGWIPQSWIRDVLAEIPFTGGSKQVLLQPGQVVTILVPAVPMQVPGMLCTGTPQFVSGHLVTVCGPGGLTSPTLLGEPVVRSVTLAIP